MFPRNFRLGFSLSGFQSEMGVSDVDDNSDWWKWVHDQENIRCGIVSGDLPENGVGYWDLYRNYHSIASYMGVNTARLGIEWTRLFPKASIDTHADTQMDGSDIVHVDVTENVLEKMDSIVNRKALDRYREIFGDLRERGISLIINAYHWPLPLVLHDPIESRSAGLANKRNGWINHTTVVEFVKYAAYVAWKFDDMADQFSIMNEPNVVYGNGLINVKSGFPPSFPSIQAANLSKKHLIEACARSYEEMKRYTKKPVGLIYANSDIQPFSKEDEAFAEQARYQDRYSFFDSLTRGDFSWWVQPNNGEKFSEFSEPHRKDMLHKLDWIGVNYYTRAVVKGNGTGYVTLKGYGHSATPSLPSRDGREVSDFGWEVYPSGLYNLLKQYGERYDLPMIVTENGIADRLDKIRPRYLVSHIHQVERAVHDGINVQGYLHWSLMDNYEWSSGFNMKFGLVGVDLKTKRPQIRPSGLIYKRICENNGVPDDMEWMVPDYPAV